MKEKILQLRKLVPIPISEAITLLRDNDSDIETCVYLFKAKCIKEICNQTGCDDQTANHYYETEKFDTNRAISFIKDDIYDNNYKPIEGIDKTSLQYVKDWIYLVETKDFGVSLTYKHLNSAKETMLRLTEFEQIAQILRDAQLVHDTIFEGYTDNQPLEVFVRLNKRLDDSPEFQVANIQIPLQILYIKNIVSRHWRNVE